MRKIKRDYILSGPAINSVQHYNWASVEIACCCNGLVKQKNNCI
jgi:hypothetical protein